MGRSSMSSLKVALLSLALCLLLSFVSECNGKPKPKVFLAEIEDKEENEDYTYQLSTIIYAPSTTRGYAPPTTRGYAPPITRGYGPTTTPTTTRGYAAPTTRGYAAPTTRGYAAPTTIGYAAPTTK